MSNLKNSNLPGITNGTISVNVTYLGTDIDIYVESEPGDFSEEDLSQAVAKKDKTLPISHLLGYFKIRDDDGNLLTTFKDYLQIRISYSPLAWKLAKNSGAPRVGHLARSGDSWGPKWEEFIHKPADDVLVSVDPPSGNDPYGYVTIKVKSLPDPLIGDC